MSESALPFVKGDWIVHALYGIGQIMKTENRPINGRNQRCFLVETRDCEYWVPVGTEANPRIRPVVSPERLRRALTALRKEPILMDQDHRVRKTLIHTVMKDGLFLEMARLIRDLYGRARLSKLNDTEKNALDGIMERFAREWAVSADIPMDEARAKLESTLEQSLLAT
ncbi:MAG: hypothetical protein EPO32_07075 [Anaerolineae bacterium]|nr:MAG: hypothetical protein EPO32_07075 [Anaerolineae bacterium]